MRASATMATALVGGAFMWGSAAYAISWLTPFQEAYRRGAKARIVLRVVDDGGRPVQGAHVKVFFSMADDSKGQWTIAQTDTNGLCVAEARTKGVLEIDVSREGYYRSREEISFIDMGHEHEVRNDKWQPWGMVRRMTLLPVRTPCAQVAVSQKWKTVPELRKWVGFDLMEDDFVKPYGTGRNADMEILFDWDGRWRQKEYGGMALNIRFPEKFSGGYYASRTPGSEFAWVYRADPDEVYEKGFAFFERVGGRNEKGYATNYERKMFDSSKVLVVRGRCRLNEDGTLKTAHYFQLRNIQFACDERGAAFRFLSVYNPIPNDTNIEPKR